jgi:hypothetical protein
MGYLDNSSITVDAILTKKGRELLSRNDGSFNITSFALGDDEIDYSLFNENHPNGSQYAGEAIENIPILEAFPDENNIMKHKLITLNRNITKLPIISISNTSITLNKSEPGTISPITLNLDGSSGPGGIESSGYIFTVKDARLFSSFGNSSGGKSNTSSPASGVAYSETVSGIQTLNFTAISSEALFGSNSKLITVITVEGMDTGARATVLVTINKTTSGATQAEIGTSGVEVL